MIEFAGPKRQALEQLDPIDRDVHRELSPSTVESIDPLIARLYADEGRTAEAAGRAAAAIHSAEMRGEEFFLLAHAHTALAQVAWCRGNLDRAEEALAEATRLDSGVSTLMSTTLQLRAAEIFASKALFERVDEVISAAWFGEHRRPFRAVRSTVAA